MNKGELKQILSKAIWHDQNGDPEEFWNIFYNRFLNQKMSFPYFEFIGSELYKNLPFQRVLKITDRLVEEQHLGGYVASGIVLQKHLSTDYNFSIEKACTYMIEGDAWFVTDIISDRVFGFALGLDFERTYRKLETYINHENHWIKRSVGIAVHVAVKKELSDDQAGLLFELCLKQATDNFVHVRKGCGWGIETLGKFYPHVVRKYADQILDNPEIVSWNVKKYHMGLEKARIREEKLKQKGHA